MDLASYVRTIEDYPQPGISFKDITTLLKDGEAFRYAVNAMIENLKDKKIDHIIGMDARGFIFGSAVAYGLGVGFIPARKPNKLPAEVVGCQYDLEYGSNSIEIHRDSIQPGDRIAIVDDLLATGGTAGAVESLVKDLKGELVGFEFLIELDFLKGRERLENQNIHVLIHY